MSAPTQKIIVLTLSIASFVLFTPLSAFGEKNQVPDDLDSSESSQPDKDEPDSSKSSKPDKEITRKNSEVLQTREFIQNVALVSETLTPDVRAQYRNDWRVIFSWPIGITLLEPDTERRGTYEFGVDCNVCGHLSVYAEPQIESVSKNIRLLGYVRPELWLVSDDGSGGAFLAEGGGLWGQDGSGAFVGAGLGVGREKGDFEVMIAPVGRATFVGNGPRYDITLDVTISPW